MTRTVSQRMSLTLLALMPGVGALAWFTGPSIVLNIGFACIFAVCFEAPMLLLRRQPLRLYLSDYSAPISASLFALLLPSDTPLEALVIGIAAAIIIAKQLAGGLGKNRFNPAMIGLAVVALGYPEIFTLAEQNASQHDNSAVIASAFGLGGLVLVGLRIVPWRTPMAVICGAIVACLLLWLFAGDSATSPHLRWLEWPLVLTAFFIASDPVTGCYTAQGRIVFGLALGVLAILFGELFGRAQGIAYAVLLMNCFARFIDIRCAPVRP